MGFAMGNSGRWLAACALLWSCQALAQTVTPAGQIQRATVAPVAVTQDIPFAPAHDTIITTQSAPNAWGGERTGNEPTLSDRVVSYTIDAELDPARHAAGQR